MNPYDFFKIVLGKMSTHFKITHCHYCDVIVNDFLDVDTGSSSWFPETQECLFSHGNNA